MIEVEGFKAFKGIMKITPKSADIHAFALHGDWLYKPDTKCWYAKGRSFPEEICSVMRDFTERNPHAKTPERAILVPYYVCSVCGHKHASQVKSCDHCKTDFEPILPYNSFHKCPICGTSPKWSDISQYEDGVKLTHTCANKAMRVVIIASSPQDLVDGWNSRVSLYD